MNAVFIVTNLLLLAIAWRACRQLESREVFKQTGILMMGGAAMTILLGTSVLFDFIEAQPTFHLASLIGSAVAPALIGLALLCLLNLLASVYFFKRYKNMSNVAGGR